MTQQFVVEEFSSVERGSLRGFATIRAPSGIVFHSVGIYQKEGAAWASPPSRPKLGRDGAQMRDREGKLLWLPVVSFASKDVRDRFSAAVIEALRASNPEALM